MKRAYDIRADALADHSVLALLQEHLDDMHRWSPACKVHAMPAERLRADDVTFFAAWDGEALAAVGALKELSPTRGELKSMRAALPYRGKGAGRAMLGHLVAEAHARGYKWLGLETGRAEAFAAAVRLYTANGFAECENFGDYVSDGFSLCMSRAL